MKARIAASTGLGSTVLPPVLIRLRNPGLYRLARHCRTLAAGAFLDMDISFELNKLRLMMCMEGAQGRHGRLVSLFTVPVNIPGQPIGGGGGSGQPYQLWLLVPYLSQAISTRK